MTRIKAFLIHLGISSAIFLVLLGMIVFVWFPVPYFTADGGWQGIRIIAGVDFVLGPLLTLIVFKPGKKTLRFDLSVIALIQTAALAFGIATVYQQRTVLIAYANHAFYSVGSERAELDPAIAQYVAQSATVPAHTYVRLPADAKERGQFTIANLKAGMPLYALSERYEPIGPDNLADIASHSLDIEAMAQGDEHKTGEVAAFRARHQGTLADHAFLPVACRYANVVLAMRRSDGAIVDSLDIDTTRLVSIPFMKP